MSMVVHPANLVRQDLFFATNAGHQGPEFRPAVQRNKLATLLGAEYNMKKVLNVRVGHVCALFFVIESVSRLRRSGILIRLPTALPWANLWSRLRRLERRVRLQMRSQKVACKERQTDLDDHAFARCWQSVGVRLASQTTEKQGLPRQRRCCNSTGQSKRRRRDHRLAHPRAERTRRRKGG